MAVRAGHVLVWLDNFTGSAFFWLLGIGLDAVFAVGSFTLHWSIWWLIGWTLIMAAAAVIHASWKTWRDIRPQQTPTRQLPAALEQFDPDAFFASSYQSALTGETEANMRAFAARYQNLNEREDFYLKLIGLGLVAYFYDETWWVIWRSQVLLLQRLNTSVLTVEEAKAFYDAPAKEDPGLFATYSYDSWLNYVFSRELMFQQGTQLALTPRGRDFLKYLVHNGRAADQRKY